MPPAEIARYQGDSQITTELKWTLLHVTLLTPKIYSWLLILGKFVDHNLGV